MSNTKIMTTLDIIQAAIRENPGDLVAWAALKDYLLETGTYLPWKWSDWTADLRVYWRIDLSPAHRIDKHIRYTDSQDCPVSTAEAISVKSHVWFEDFEYEATVAFSWIRTCPQLRRVHIRDKEPLQDGRKWYWVMDKDKHPERHCLPQKVLDCMGSSYNGYRSFNTRREAMRALSEAALSWAGKKAGEGK